jgi:endoglucanase
VEGINWTGIPVDGFAHGRPTLTPARWLSHTLVTSGKLVYAAHFYDYTGPNHSGATGIGETSDPRYRDFTRDELFNVLNRDAFFVSQEPGQHFTAPVWISEFGVDGSAPVGSKQREWFTNFIDYLIQADADFAYWPVVGWSETRGANNWALLFWDRSGQVAYGDQWRTEIWRRLVGSAGRTGVVDPVTRWDMLSPDHGDFVQSSTLRDRPDWDSGARKAACPDGERLAGMAHTGNRGLCTDVNGAVTGYEVVKDDRYVTNDWASGYTKLQCPAGAFVVGYAVRGAAMSSVICGLSNAAGAGGRTLWFDRGDNRPAGNPGGDFASGNYKGQCAAGEQLIGVAYTGRIGKSKSPDALYCQTTMNAAKE